MVVFLPFFKPPKEVLNIQGTVLTSMTFAQAKAEYPDATFPLYGFEMDLLFRTPAGKRIEDADSLRLAVLQTSDDKVPNACYTALLDLLTGHWRYVLKRTEFLSQLTLTNGVPEYPDLPRYSFNTSLLGKFSRGVELLSTNRRFRISNQRWHSSYTREDPLDTVLDCCSSLEAAFSLGDELRLRTSLSVYHVMKKNKRKAFITVYEMYGVRNKFIHGAQIPIVSPEEQEEYISTVARVLSRFVELCEIPDDNTLSNMIIEHYAE